MFISWLQTLSEVILEPKKLKSVTVSTFSPSICHEVMMGLDAMTSVCSTLSFKPALSLFCFTYIKRLFSSTSLSAIRVENILVTVNLRFSGYNTKVQMIKEKKISKLFLLKVLKIFCYSKISQKMKRSSSLHKTI